MTLNKARRDLAKQNASGVAVRSYRHIACGRGTNHVGKVTADGHKLYCDFCQGWFEKGVAGEFVWADDGTKVGT